MRKHNLGSISDFHARERKRKRREAVDLTSFLVTLLKSHVDQHGHGMVRTYFQLIIKKIFLNIDGLGWTCYSAFFFVSAVPSKISYSYF